jgi:hypothetical protein
VISKHPLAINPPVFPEQAVPAVNTPLALGVSSNVD